MSIKNVENANPARRFMTPERIMRFAAKVFVYLAVAVLSSFFVLWFVLSRTKGQVSLMPVSRWGFGQSVYSVAYDGPRGTTARVVPSGVIVRFGVFEKTVPLSAD
jgi:hypothetical protein